MTNWFLGTYERINGQRTWHVCKAVPGKDGKPKPGKPICGHGRSIFTRLGPDIEWKLAVTASHRGAIETLRKKTRFQTEAEQWERACGGCVLKIERDISAVDRLGEIVDG